MATNPHYPGRKSAKRLLNVHAHQKPGQILLRPGYELKYDVPEDSRIGNSSVINFDMFYDRQTNLDGEEITVLLQKGTVSSFDLLAIGEKIDMLCFWARPYWNGTMWVDEWQWLNETIITKIKSVDSTYHNVIEILNNGIEEDALIGYTIYNKTKSSFARIITNKSVDSTTMRINHTLFSSWEIDDVIIISRAWIDLDSLNALYNIAYNDVVFHRINNDLRIGFGGYENRPGLMIGYRKSSLFISSIDFSATHPDLEEEGVLQKFGEINRLILEPHILDTTQTIYGISLTTETGTMPEGTYHFKLTGVMDDYAEQVIAEANITVNSQDIFIQPYIVLGKDNLRITKTNLYYSTDGITYYKIREDNLRSFGSTPQSTLIIDGNGRLNTESLSLEGSGEFHRNANAANITNEANTIGEWANIGYVHPSIPSLFPTVGYMHPVIGSVTPPNGTHLLLWQNPLSSSQWMAIRSPLITADRKLLTVSFKIIARYVTIRVSSTGIFPNPFNGGQDFRDIVLEDVMDWQEISFDMYVEGSLTFWVMQGNVGNQRIGIDSLTVTNPNAGDIQLGTEMRTAMGYTPTLNLVRGWDQALKLRGRIYYLNPFVEKRYENYILVSHIHSSGAFMWDIASFSNFREIERYDSNSAIGMKLLPTMEIMILKDRSFEIIADDGIAGIPREPILDVSCVSRDTVQDILGTIFVCGEEDIYMFSVSKGVTPILKESIRDIYLAIEHKKDLFATRDKHNTYRIRIPDKVNKTEFLFTENGPIEERKYHYADIYRIGKGGILHFLSGGKIYAVDPELGGGILVDDEGNYLVDDDENTITDG